MSRVDGQSPSISDSQCVNAKHAKPIVRVNGVELQMHTPTSNDTVIIRYSNNYLGSNL